MTQFVHASAEGVFQVAPDEHRMALACDQTPVCQMLWQITSQPEDRRKNPESGTGVR